MTLDVLLICVAAVGWKFITRCAPYSAPSSCVFFQSIPIQVWVWTWVSG